MLASALSRVLMAGLLALALPVGGAGKSVLLLQQDDEAWPAYQAFYGGFRDALVRDFGADVVIYRENLDLTRFPDAAYRDALRRWYLAKYQAVSLDGIVALGPASFNFALAARRDMWQAVPIVFAGGNENTMAIAAAAGNAAGTTLRVETAKTLALARALFPDARNLALVGDRELRDTYFLGYDEALADARRDFALIDLRGLPMAQLLDRLAALPPGSIVHYTMLSVDGSGQRFTPRDALARIAAQSVAPVFGDLDSYMGTGAIGGQMTDIRAFGAATARRLVPVLKRVSDGATPDPAASWSAPVMDWRALKRWGVDEGRLPAGTDVRFRTPSAWEEHRGSVIVVAVAFAVLLALIARLLHERRQRLLAEAEASARLTELARANRISAAGEFGAAIAHDLGQPLAAIQSNVEAVELLLGSQPPRVEEARAVLADVLRDDQRAADVIARLRQLYRKSEARPGFVRVDRLVDDVIGMAAGTASRRGVTVVREVDHPPAGVVADAVQLQQVFINLLLNALDAIAERSGPKRVVISARRAGGGKVRLSVADSGPGVPESERGRVFEPFYTTKAKGTGVGLAIVRRIVEGLGSRVEVSASTLGGADFSFLLAEAKAGP